MTTDQYRLLVHALMGLDRHMNDSTTLRALVTKVVDVWKATTAGNSLVPCLSSAEKGMCFEAITMAEEKAADECRFLLEGHWLGETRAAISKINLITYSELRKTIPTLPA